MRDLLQSEIMSLKNTLEGKQGELRIRKVKGGNLCP